MNGKTWRIAHASAVGAAHLSQNVPCQDRSVCRTVESSKDGEVLIAVIADGAGSTARGQDGAQTACDFFASEVEKFLQNGASVGSLNEDFGKRLVEYFQKKITDLAASEGVEMREYASTLVAAVVSETNAAFYQIGDGAVIFASSDENAGYRFGIKPAESLYVNMTDFLTDEDAAQKIRHNLVEERIEDLILFSDGIYPVAVDYQTNQPHVPFLKPMLAPLQNVNLLNGLNEKLEKFLASPKINEKTDDDKTIILASRRAGQATVRGESSD
jgi:Serine/threonine protein phosphatase